jgi:acyl-CoA hydrolase
MRVQNGRTVAESTVDMVELVLPNDANPLGNILGGRVMHLIDIAGGIAAHRHSRCEVVTASVDYVDFVYPIRVGHLIRLKAFVTRAFRTSMEVEVNVFMENYQTGDLHQTSSAFVTYVALDRLGRPTPVPRLILRTTEERRRHREALTRRRHRLAMAARVHRRFTEKQS